MFGCTHKLQCQTKFENQTSKDKIDLHLCWSIANFSVKGCVPDIRPRECIKKYCPWGSISQYSPQGAGSVLDDTMDPVDHIM